MAMTEQQICQIARVCYETFRALQKPPQTKPPWEIASEETQDRMEAGVSFMVKHPDATPERIHRHWMECMMGDKWTCGVAFNSVAREHNEMRPYSELEDESRMKIQLFRAIVRTMRLFYDEKFD